MVRRRLAAVERDPRWLARRLATVCVLRNVEGTGRLSARSGSQNLRPDLQLSRCEAVRRGGAMPGMREQRHVRACVSMVAIVVDACARLATGNGRGRGAHLRVVLDAGLFGSDGRHNGRWTAARCVRDDPGSRQAADSLFMPSHAAAGKVRAGRLRTPLIRRQGLQRGTSRTQTGGNALLAVRAGVAWVLGRTCPEGR